MDFFNNLDEKQKKYLIYGLVPTFIVDGLLIAFVPHQYYDYIAFGVLFLTMIVCLVLMTILRKNEASHPHPPKDSDSYSDSEGEDDSPLSSLGVQLKRPPMWEDKHKDDDERW